MCRRLLTDRQALLDEISSNGEINVSQTEDQIGASVPSSPPFFSRHSSAYSPARSSASSSARSSARSSGGRASRAASGEHRSSGGRASRAVSGEHRSSGGAVESPTDMESGSLPGLDAGALPGLLVEPDEEERRLREQRDLDAVRRATDVQHVSTAPARPARQRAHETIGIRHTLCMLIAEESQF